MLFNIYYVNTFKMYEIKMMINNKMKTSEQSEGNKIQEEDLGVEASIEANGVGFFKSKLKGKANSTTTDTKRFVENFDIKTTKSIMLNEVIQKAKAMSNMKKDEFKEGMLVKVDSISVELTNAQEIMGVKALNNDSISMVYEGIDVGKIFNSALKDYSYIFTGVGTNNQKFIFKIPVTFDNEFESMYSYSDILIGKISLVGIYKGIVDKSDVKNVVDIVANQQEENGRSNQDIDIMNSDDELKNDSENDEKYHYIDIIAIIQELHIENN